MKILRLSIPVQAAILASMSHVAYAQASTPQSPPPPAAEEQTGIADIVVTAQRRSESSQDVPIAITAFSGDSLDKQGVQSLPQLSQVTPGLQFQAIGSSSVPFLRGVGASATGAGAEAATAVYVDGVYVSNQSASLMALPNVASVEVLKGPQGTLFGRNATAGVIQLTTRRPTQDTTIEGRVGYANYNTWDASLYASTGLSQDAAIDLVVYGTERNKGWGTNLTTGGDVYTNSNFLARSRLLLTLGENTEINITGGYERIRDDTGFATRLPRPGELGQNEAAAGSGIQFTGGFYDVTLNDPSGSVMKKYSASLDLLQRMGSVDFRSITAYQDVDVRQSVDFDLTANPSTFVTLHLADKVFTQEFQLLSSDENDSRLSWILGLYYYHQNASYPDDGIRQFVTPPPALFLDSTQKTNSYAAFGQGTYKLGEDTNLTLGLRYTRDKRCLDGTQSLAGTTVIRQQQGCETFPKLTYKATLDHHFNEDVMVYGQYSRGFKSGYFNAQTLQSAAGDPPSVPSPVRPETLDAYEIGLKSDMFERRLRLNLAAFYYDYQDLQVNAFITSTNRITINAASAKIKGVEAQIQAQPTEGLDLVINAAYLDATYKSFPGAPFFTPRTVAPFGLAAFQADASGNRLPNSAEFTGTFSATYSTDVGGGDLSINGTAYYNSGSYFEPQNRLKQDDYLLLSSSLSWTDPSDHYTISLWGNNLTNRKVLSSANATAGGDSLTVRAPRTYGVRLGFKF